MLERLIALGSLPVLMLALIAAGAGVPIPEDVVLLAAGVTAHSTWWPWWVVLPSVFASAIGADCLLFVLARRYGEALLARRPLRWIVTPPRRRRVSALFRIHGARAIFVGRHLSGVRPVVFALAAIEGLPFRAFLAWDALAGLVTVPFVFGLGYLFSAHLAAVRARLARAEHWAVAIAAALLLIGWQYWRRRRARS